MTDQVDDGFSAGFDSVAGTKSQVAAAPPPVESPQPTPEPAAVETPPAEVAPVEEPAVDAAALEEALKEELIPGFTTDQLKALLAKTAEVDTLRSQYDKVAGHIGTLIQDVRALKAPPKQPEVEVDMDKFRDDYPDIAAATQKRIDEGLARFGDLEKLLAQEIAQRQELAAELQMERLSREHPDWVETINGNDYKMWLATQPPEVQKIATETTAAADLSKILGTFKDSGKKLVQQAKNTARLESALTPTGAAPVRPAEPTEIDAFKAGWNAVRH